jgi:hypothetical protein
MCGCLWDYLSFDPTSHGRGTLLAGKGSCHLIPLTKSTVALQWKHVTFFPVSAEYSRLSLIGGPVSSWVHVSWTHTSVFRFQSSASSTRPRAACSAYRWGRTHWHWTLSSYSALLTFTQTSTSPYNLTTLNFIEINTIYTKVLYSSITYFIIPLF